MGFREPFPWDSHRLQGVGMGRKAPFGPWECGSKVQIFVTLSWCLVHLGEGAGVFLCIYFLFLNVFLYKLIYNL